MEPNQNIENDTNMTTEEPVVSEQIVTEQVTESVEPSPAMPMESTALPEKKKSNGMLLGLILCLLLTAGGIGFGVWVMMDGNSRVDSLNAKIKTLQDEKNDLLGQIDKLNEELKNMENNEWSELSTELENGVFYVLDENGEAIAQTDDSIEIKEVVSCDWSADNTIMDCEVVTREGNGQLLYDVFSESTVIDFEIEKE